MMPNRFDRYRALSAQIGAQRARTLIDRLQVLALTEPDTVREMEKFLDRGGTLGPSLDVRPAADKQPDPDPDD